jgi:hypothetical protein
VNQLFLVGCEPSLLEDNGAMELSPPVREAVPGAVAMIEKLARRITEGVPLPKPETAAANR